MSTTTEPTIDELELRLASAQEAVRLAELRREGAAAIETAVDALEAVTRQIVPTVTQKLQAGDYTARIGAAEVQVKELQEQIGAIKTERDRLGNLVAATRREGALCREKRLAIAGMKQQEAMYGTNRQPFQGEPAIR